jgi:methyl-accepting chemotaxis protein
VRALAQRSAQAAKEIKGLISTSAAHVDLRRAPGGGDR